MKRKDFTSMRQKSTAELVREAAKRKQDLVNRQLTTRLRREKNVRLNLLRDEIARIDTVIKEKNLRKESA